MNNNAPSPDGTPQLLTLTATLLRRPPLSSTASGSMGGRHVTSSAVADKSVSPCSANALPDKTISDRGINMSRAVGRPGRKRRGPQKNRPTESMLVRLIAEVIGNQSGNKALIGDIYRCLRQKEPGYFSSRVKDGWQGRVRRLLSKHKELFVKTLEKGPGCGTNRTNKGYYWQLQSDRALSLSVQSSTGAVPVSAVGPRE